LNIRVPDRRQPSCAKLSRNFLRVSVFVMAMWSLVLHMPEQLRAYAQTTTQPTGHASDQTPRTAPATQQILSSYEGQNVTAIEIAGRPDIDTGKFSSAFVQRAGEPFSREKVDQTVAALKAVGKFKEVQLQVSPEAEGVRVLMILEPAVYFGIFEFPGAERFAYSRLVQIANFPPEAPFNAGDIQRDQDSLLKFFQQEGYFKAEVKPEVKVDAAHSLANITFHVTLNRRAKFGEIKIVDATPEEAAILSAKLKTLLARARGAAIRPGKNYRRATLNNATRYLQTQLEKHDRLAAQVKLEGAAYNAETNRADIEFSIKPGPQIHVDIEGAHLWSWTRRSLLPVYQGVGVDPELVQEGNRALVSYFQAKGYFDIKVDSQMQSKNAVDTITYQIDKEKKHKVADVNLTGNSHMKSDDLLPHITVLKAHFLSHGKFSEQLVRNSAKNLAAVYESEGYSSVVVTPTVVNHGGDVRISFKIVEGPQDIVNSLKIEGADTYPQSKFAPSGLKLAAGRPYSEKLVQDDRTNIVSHYLQAGYLTSSFRETAAQADKNDPHRIDVVYHVYEGPQVFAGDVLTLGRNATKQRLIDRDVSSIKPSQPLTETQLLTAESQLYNHTGVFDWAEVDPKRQITTQTKEDVLVKVHEARKNQITYGFGFEVINRGGSLPSGTVALPGLPPVGLPSNFSVAQTTFYGPRGTFQYTRNNVRGKGESLSFTGFAGRLDQRAAAYYIDPNFLWSKWSSTISISGERNEENPIFSSQSELGSYQIQRFLDKPKADILFLRYSFSQTNLTRLEIPDLVPVADQHVRLSTVSANVTRDTRDNVLDAHKGVLQSIELDVNSSKLGSSVNFLKLNGQAAYYRQILHNIVWANSIRMGLAQPYLDSRVPLSEEFFTGGGNTLRGFPLDGAGPQRSIQVCNASSPPVCSSINIPSGGNELLLLNSEFRIPLPIKKGLGMVVFYDGGNVFPNVGFHDFTSLYSNNVGVGLRYATPVGPVRIDLGRNLNPVTGVQATQYFISIGQAF
jgi:outer membrane protein insertion porin family